MPSTAALSDWRFFFHTRRSTGLPANAPTGPPAETGQAGPFFYAEGYHQQYLAKNPGGYCGLGGTGVACPVGLASAEHAES